MTNCASYIFSLYLFFFQAEDGIRDKLVTGVQTCALLPKIEVVDALEHVALSIFGSPRTRGPPPPAVLRLARFGSSARLGRGGPRPRPSCGSPHSGLPLAPGPGGPPPRPPSAPPPRTPGRRRFGTPCARP